MRFRPVEHILSLILVGAVFLVIALSLPSGKQSGIAADAKISGYTKLDFIDFDNGVDRALFRDSYSIFHPEQPDPIPAIDEFRRNLTVSQLNETSTTGQILAQKGWALLGMYLQFIFTFILVMAVTYYGVQTLALWRFIRYRQLRTATGKRLHENIILVKTSRNWHERLDALGILATMLFKGLGIVLGNIILFAPAYVIAYSLRTRFDTSSLIFMILLGVVSNGLLVIYTQKFYSFLVHESQRGYTKTAIVKNLDNNYNFSKTFTLRMLLHPAKKFPGHVLDHIFRNARFQYLATVREQAAFLVTGLIIIEMALNIQNHLCYELLQHILYRQYGIVLLIAFAIFALIKATDILIDYRIFLATRRIENAEVQQ